MLKKRRHSGYRNTQIHNIYKCMKDKTEPRSSLTGTQLCPVKPMSTDRVYAWLQQSPFNPIQIPFCLSPFFSPTSRGTLILLALHLNRNNHNNITFFLTPSVSPSQRLPPLSRRSSGNETD